MSILERIALFLRTKRPAACHRCGSDALVLAPYRYRCEACRVTWLSSAQEIAH